MFIVKGFNVGPRRPAINIINMAIGEEDQYGNPFEIIELRWRSNRLHRMANYAKSRGFEDAIIGRGRGDKEFDITYRDNGSVMWERNGDTGPFVGKLPRTPKNIKLLATHYKDALWRIHNNPSVEAEVKALSEKIWESMSPELREYNEQRIKLMHTHQLEQGQDLKFEEVTVEEISQDLKDKKKLMFEKERELADREAKLQKKEKAVNEKAISIVESGVPLTSRERPYYQRLKMHEVRKEARKLGLSWVAKDTKEKIIDKILEVQKTPKVESVVD